MKGILGTKIAMTQMFDSNGKSMAVTIIKAEPNVVLAVKTKQKDKYDAIQLGFKEKKEKNVNKASLGQFKKANTTPKQTVKEIRDMVGKNVGDTVGVNTFSVGEIVDVEGITKGHGYTGAIQRWNMTIGPMSHGAGYPHRFQGSLGGGRGGSSAQHVFKGKKMSGHYGVEAVTVENLQVIDIDEANNLIVLKGSTPGPKGCLVVIKAAQKNYGKVKDFKLSNVAEESRKNKILEEAKHYNLNLAGDTSLKDMEKALAEAKKNGPLEHKKEQSSDQKSDAKK